MGLPEGTVALAKETFAEQVKDALLHLYDVAYLPRLELAYILTEDRSLSWQERAQGLRRTLVRAIERLDPGSHLSPRARERRSYTILSSRYARSMQTREVMEELAISERQYWREHRKALDALTDLLWEEYGKQAQDRTVSILPPGEREAVAREEAGLMASHSNPEEVSVAEVIHQVAWTLQEIIQSKGVHLEIHVPELPLLAFVDRTIMRQICLNLLSYALDATADGIVSVLLCERSGRAQLIVTTAVHPGRETRPEKADLRLNVVHQLVGTQNGRVHIQEEKPGRWSATIGFPTIQSKPVLVIDDNSAIVSLFKRYLARSKYRVIGAETGDKALRLAGQVRPVAVTLDVMMPGQDGWETLQALKAMPELHGVPVIVCSVLDEPELAYSLGADDFIRKPISQSVLLQTLDRWPTRSGGSAPTRPE
jgi:CheY-like chemotaxis protein